ncbi:ATP-grasp domain-containing protein [Emticicia fluvialis]|uniref:ATP-grasp domain-containing protein n=1 Tax=Emticicia fluvialis TaxID=2974474 RepID=UPI002165EA98|nr:hypothetical protein [Emticicia fluvialis]
MFLIIGYHNEKAIEHFVKVLAEQKQADADKYHFLNLSDVETATDVQVSYDADDLLVKIDDRQFDFANYHAIYARCLYQTPADKAHVLRMVNFIFLMHNYLEFCDKVVVNRPCAGNSNYTKLHHVTKLQAYGFSVPETYIFGSGTRAKHVMQPNGDWISKGTSSIRTRAVELDEKLYAELYQLNHVPSLFQRHIRGYDVRLHLLGSQPLALKIESPNVDYRYNTSGNQYQRVDIPPDLLKKCIDYCREEELLFAGIDFKVTPTGEWVMLEINNTPGYNFFDTKMNYAISMALFDFLSQTPDQLAPFRREPAATKTFIPPERRTMS